MVEGGKYHDSLEELFTRQNIVEWYSLSISDSKIFRNLTKPGRFLLFGFTHLCAFINVALSYESDWRALVNDA